MASTCKGEASRGEAEAGAGQHYDASDQRVIKRASFAGGEGGQEDRYTLYLFDTLELRRAEFDLAGDDEYDYTEDTVVPYLLANSVRLARVMWEFNSLPAVDAGQAHVFFRRKGQVRMRSSDLALTVQRGSAGYSWRARAAYGSDQARRDLPIGVVHPAVTSRRIASTAWFS